MGTWSSGILNYNLAHNAHSLQLKARTEACVLPIIYVHVMGNSLSRLSDDSSNRPTYCMKLLFATPHLVARKSFSNNGSAICGEFKSITMACKLAKFPQQNCTVQNQFRGPGNRHQKLWRLFKHSAGAQFFLHIVPAEKYHVLSFRELLSLSLSLSLFYIGSARTQSGLIQLVHKTRAHEKTIRDIFLPEQCAKKKMGAGHTVDALYFCEQWISSKQWPLHEHKYC